MPDSAVQGGWAAYQGGTFSFDARLESPIAPYWPEFGTLVLTSAQGTLSQDIAPGDEPTTAWQTFSVKLDPTAWSATPQQFNGVLSSLQRVEINLEAGNGAIETVHVDNVRVTAVPEPSSLALLAVGGVGLACLAGRRRRA